MRAMKVIEAKPNLLCASIQKGYLCQIPRKRERKLPRPKKSLSALLSESFSLKRPKKEV